MTILEFKSTLSQHPSTIAGGQGDILAALDLGTNNCRLLVARAQSAEFKVIGGFSRIVRLGEGLARAGSLSNPAMDRTLSALRICTAKIQRYRPRAMRVVATQACRQADNGADFLNRVRQDTGLPMEMISAQEEAILTLAGCSALLTHDKPQALVFDIGGGSTEIIWLDVPPQGPPRIRAWISLPLGVVSLSECHTADSLDSGYLSMRADIMAPLKVFEAQNDIRAAIASGKVQMLGTSGTVTTLAGIHFKLERYDRSYVDGCVLSFEDLAKALHHVLTLDRKSRNAHPCIGCARADLVIAGCAILDSICEIWPVGRLRIADRGMREGILLGLMGIPAPVFCPSSMASAI